LAAVVQPPVVGGWVPPPDASDEDAASDEEPDASDPEEGELVPWLPDEQAPPVADRAPAAIGGLGLLLDPGRRGLLALAVVAVAAALVAGLLLWRSRPTEVAAPAVERVGAAVAASPGAGGEVVVSVAGKVRRPGLVRLPPGSRVDDAVRAAGGATAPVGLLNLARRVVDGEQVLVGIAGGAPGTTGGGPAAGALLDLNAATAEQLDGLPGIGPVLAERIVDWRTEHGRFGSVDQLREVPGIGESKYAQVKAKVSV
jgi:competence protein ComEA